MTDDTLPMTDERAADPVAHLWECLGRWSWYIATNGEQAELAPPQWLTDAVNAATSPAAPHPAQQAGDMVMVPREPTPEMIRRAVEDCGDMGAGSCGEYRGVDGDDMRAVWDAMLAAAPALPAQQAGGDFDAVSKGWLAALSDARYAARGNDWLTGKLVEIHRHFAASPTPSAQPEAVMVPREMDLQTARLQGWGHVESWRDGWNACRQVAAALAAAPQPAAPAQTEADKLRQANVEADRRVYSSIAERYWQDAAPAAPEQVEVPDTFRLPDESDDEWLDRITGAAPAAPEPTTRAEIHAEVVRVSGINYWTPYVDEAAAPAAPEQGNALENCRLYAARHRSEEWAKAILRFCAEAGVTGSPLRAAAPAAPAGMAVPETVWQYRQKHPKTGEIISGWMPCKDVERARACGYEVRQVVKCWRCEGQGWTEEGDPEIGSAPHDCTTCDGDGCLAASPSAQAAPARGAMTEEDIERATGAKRGEPLFLVALGFTRAIERFHGIGTTAPIASAMLAGGAAIGEGKESKDAA